MTRLYKILAREDWEAAVRIGVYRGSAVDLADGFIHFSTAQQAPETARRHFRGRDELAVLAVDAEALGEALRWEPSRGGELFPHLYGPLETDRVLEVTAAPLDADDAPILGDLLP